MKLQTILALGFGLVLTGILWAGCESESVAPDEELPPLSTEDVASQAGFVAMAVTALGNEFAGFEPTAKNLYTYTFGPASVVQGTVYFTFLTGGAGGQQAPYDQADWGHAATGVGEALTVTAAGLNGAIAMTADVIADPYDPAAQTATLTGAGTVTTGDYTSDWSVDAMPVAADGFPDGGTLAFAHDEISVEVYFDGDGVVSVTVDDVVIGTIDLSNGVFQEISP